MIQYAYTILYVNDVEASLSFYEKAFGFQRKFITPEQDYGELVSGATCIAFAQINLAKSNLKEGFQESKLSEKPFGIELGFTSEEVEALLSKALAAGAQTVEPLTEKPWGQKVAYVRDNNGFLIELCTPMKS